MPRNPRQTSRAAVTAASRVLRGARFSKTSKRAAGSALAQTPSKRRRRK